MPNTSGNYTGCRPQSIHIFFPIFLSLIIFVGFVLNSISLWIFWFRVKQWNSAVVLQFNLAISDAIITLAAPLIIIHSLTDNWIFGTFLCQFRVFLLCIHTYGSIYFLTLISIHRYFTVARNVKKTVWTKKPFITKLCLAVWGCLLLQGMPFFFVLKTSKVNGVTKCLNIHQTEYALLYFVWNMVIHISGALIPFSITLVCYTLLSRYLLMVNPRNTLSKVMVSKSIQTIFISLIIFLICYIPPHLTKTIAITIKLYFPAMCPLLERVEVAYYTTWMISGTNCLIDPILYCFASDKFRKAFTVWCGFLYVRSIGQRYSTDEVLGNQVESASEDHHCRSLSTENRTEMGIAVTDRCEK